MSTKPYLIRAIFEWCVDQGFVPYLTVAADAGTRVPREYVKDGQITLNIGAEASHQLMLGNEEITFQARFNGAAFPVVVPVNAVVAIFARENGQGMAFEAIPSPVSGDADINEDTEPAPEAASPEKPRPHLTRIK
jgi:stringent starvation protein B